jgi:hypothetical protein
MGGMEPLVELDLADLRLRTLTLADEDAALLVEATRAASASALWGPRPAGPYSLEAARSALQAWDPHHGRQVSFGVLDGPRLVAALGLMPDGPHSAELAYWVRPEDRRRGIALRSVQSKSSSGGRARRQMVASSTILPLVWPVSKRVRASAAWSSGRTVSTTTRSAPASTSSVSRSSPPASGRTRNLPVRTPRRAASASSVS